MTLVVAGFVGWAAAIANLEENLKRLVGEPIDTASARLGKPNQRQPTYPDMATRRDDPPTREITLLADAITKVIKRYSWTGSGTGCTEAEAKLTRS